MKNMLTAAVLIGLFTGGHQPLAAAAEQTEHRTDAMDEYALPDLIIFGDRVRGEIADGTPQFVFCRQGGRDYINAFERIEEGGRVHYKVAGEVSDTDKGEGTDIYAVE